MSLFDSIKFRMSQSTRPREWFNLPVDLKINISREYNIMFDQENYTLWDPKFIKATNNQISKWDGDPL